MRKRVFLTTFLVVVSLVLVTATAMAAPQGQKRITLIIYTSANVEFFAPLVQGANDAAKMAGVNVDIQYGDSNPERQNNLIETAIANKVDGLAVSIPDDNAYDASILEARKAGIPVVSFNVDDSKGAAGNARMAFIGQDFIQTGYLIAKRMIHDYNIKRGDLVFTPVEFPDAVYATLRHEGVQKALDEIGARSELVGTGANPADAQTTEVQYLLGHPETKAMIALGSTPLTVAPKAIQEAGVKLPLGGFDLTKDIIAGIKNGVIDATVDQQPYSQGFYAVMQLVLYARYGLYPSDMNTGGLGLVDRSNVASVEALTPKYR
jgi:simple sugar transport system substrate-binding protein